jgi:SAM-dependent methyltransferase
VARSALPFHGLCDTLCTMPTADSREYDLVASEYYSDSHQTCRNFDCATKAALKQRPIELADRGLTLELGAGRGRANEFLGVSSERIVQTDASLAMLALRDREPSLMRLCCDGRNTPFVSEQFSIVCAFLYDAFSGEEVLTEVHRVLVSGGTFVGTLPESRWGHTLRHELGLAPDETRFRLRDGRIATVSSLLWDDDQVAAHAKAAGFREIHIEHARIVLDVAAGPISRDVSSVAARLNVPIDTLDLVQIIKLRK